MLDYLLSLPWNVLTQDNLDLKRAEAVLDGSHAGLGQVKDRVLEYLAQRPMGEALDMLADAMHVMALLGARLAEQGSDYHVVFDALATLVGEPTDIEAIRQQAATEGPDETIVNMDKIWEEEAVTFLANQDGCGKSQGGRATAQPVRWVSPPGSTPQAARSL